MKRKRLAFHIVRRLIFILLFLSAFVLQFTFLPRTSFPFPVFILLPLTVSVAMFEHEFTGLFFGLMAGVLWDVASPVTDGFMALILTLSACITGLLSHYLLRNTLLSALIFTSALTLLVSGVFLLFFVPLSDFDEIRHTFLNFYLPGSLLTLLLTLPAYFTVRSITVRTRTEKIIN